MKAPGTPNRTNLDPKVDVQTTPAGVFSKRFTLGNLDPTLIRAYILIVNYKIKLFFSLLSEIIKFIIKRN